MVFCSPSLLAGRRWNSFTMMPIAQCNGHHCKIDSSEAFGVKIIRKATNNFHFFRKNLGREKSFSFSSLILFKIPVSCSVK